MQVAYPRLQPALTEAVCACAGCCHDPAPPRMPRHQQRAPHAAPAAGATSAGAPRFSAAEAAAEAVLGLEADIAAADPGYTCLFDARQTDAWAAGLLKGEGEWEAALRDEAG